MSNNAVDLPQGHVGCLQPNFSGNVSGPCLGEASFAAGSESLNNVRWKGTVQQCSSTLACRKSLARVYLKLVLVRVRKIASLRLHFSLSHLDVRFSSRACLLWTVTPGYVGCSLLFTYTFACFVVLTLFFFFFFFELGWRSWRRTFYGEPRTALKMCEAISLGLWVKLTLSLSLSL